MSFDLPELLTRNLADAEVEVVAWSAETRELVLRVRKEIGGESGFLRFLEVSRVNLAPRLTISGISVSSPDSRAVTSEATEATFVIEEAWGENYYVIAEAVGYSVEE